MGRIILGVPNAKGLADWLRMRGVESREVRISMASVGEPEENGYAERLRRTIKEEEVDLSEYCQDIHELDATRLLEQFQKLERERECAVSLPTVLWK